MDAAKRTLSAKQPHTPAFLLGIALLIGIFAWAYWPTFVEILMAWDSQPDYSHGYFVVPISIWFLWLRKDRVPLPLQPALIPGIAIIAASCVLRYFGARFYLGGVDGWSFVIWIAGLVVAFAGWRVFFWSLPSIGFLLFMIPVPYRLEIMFRQPLQVLATKISCAMLVMLHQPALAEGNTIRIGSVRFGIVEACSGLRIFIGIVALAFVYLVLVKRSWVIRALLLLAVLPITLIANSTRIVLTCLLYFYVSSDASKKFSHDLAGFMTVPFAGVLFGLVLWYLGLLLHETNVSQGPDGLLRAKGERGNALPDSSS